MFERNSKNNSTYATLGNVFRNSKWSDLKVQNIKMGFSRQFYLLLIFVITSFMVSLTSPQILIYDSYFFVTELMLSLIDIITIVFVLTIVILSDLLITYVTVPICTKILDYYGHDTTVEEDLSFSQQSVDKSNDYKLVNTLYRTSSVVNLNNFDTILTNPTQKNLTNWVNTQGNPLLYKPNYLTELNIGSSKNITMSLQNLNKLLSNKHFILNSGNFSKDLDLMKSDRWVLKNSLLSEDVIRNTNSYTNAKKLIGLNVLNSQLSNKNVWASTNLNKLNSTNMASLQSLLNESDNSQLFVNHLNSSNLGNFNFFEESRLFLVNKYSYSNKLRYNLLAFDDKFNDKSISDRLISNNNFNNHYNLFQSSLDFNINNLLLTKGNVHNDLNKVMSKNDIVLNYFIVNNDSYLLTNLNLNNLINLTSTHNNLEWYNYFN
jgi:hypothetical protein